MLKASQFSVGESFDLLLGKRRSASDQKLLAVVYFVGVAFHTNLYKKKMDMGVPNNI